ncbi:MULTISPECIES: ATP-grasp domain-containing protein [unclassified Staphylococcus]|uniref:L-aspartate--L-methionine ligase LdmS n=1 Tax=unclassified Staphylococcus TaxID=91994 RepID=UPI0021D2E4CF|nr:MULTISPECIES: ATP-grasp domain-containing protein [unclassified Staphylococcus]UXR69166.1 ATP-grasp domain-containing protein [Staphylococcus sp. IVB6246]UXR71220.1 ATP-grasp domain-containing protein [Staphylococcus sp. IVB6240]UXR73494.1 ATP-grasp domain-containing protein [Staphylococcus sp. IVB6238]UXR75813.1 ATP-grasp domain-containing protein [Staphylococcus sp. IVB6233]UXR80011.1 ATP-grasp domain-containing protein [Staphylococcus sp. IVB6218]
MTNVKNSHSYLTMAELYSNDVVYSSRPSYISNPWLEPDEHQSNFLSARELLIANMPVIVHEASVTDKLAQLFELVHRSIPDNLYYFKDQSSYESLLQRLTLEEDRKIYFQYVHGEDIVPADKYAMNKQTFIDLNNKSKIPEWTNGKYLPKREVVPFKAFEDAVREWELPVVIKPGDDLPTAGGYGVMICYTQEELEKAIERVKKAEAATDTLIIEQCIDVVDNYCVQFAKHPDKGILYLGAAKQLTNAYGFYQGNINAQHVPQTVIDAGRALMERAVEEGFIGVAGFDLLEDADGEVYAIDLNYRQNGSTSMLLLADCLEGDYHKFYSYVANGDNERFHEAIKTFIKKGVLFPLSYYDGDWYTDQHVDSRFGCIWHAESEADIEEYEQEFLEAAGLKN